MLETHSIQLKSFAITRADNLPGTKSVAKAALLIHAMNHFGKSWELVKKYYRVHHLPDRSPSGKYASYMGSTSTYAVVVTYT